MASYQSSLSIADSTATTESHFIEADGIKIHYRTRGEGPVLVLLHGITLSSEQWSLFMESFAKRYTVIAPDFPGHGKSDRLPTGFGFDKWARLILNMLNQVGVEKIKAIGHSAGAHTLLHMAVENPDLIESMILVGGGHRSTQAVADELKNDSFDKADKPLRDYYRSIHGNNMDRINAMFLDVRHMSQIMPANFNHTVWNQQILSKITTPVYLVWGDGDDLFPVEIAVELYQTLPDARLWVIPAQGHTPLWPFMGGDESASARFPGIAEEFFTEYSGEQATAAQF